MAARRLASQFSGHCPVESQITHHASVKRIHVEVADQNRLLATFLLLDFGNLPRNQLCPSCLVTVRNAPNLCWQVHCGQQDSANIGVLKPPNGDVTSRESCSQIA